MGFMAPKMLEMFEGAMQENEKKSALSKYKDYKEVEKASKDMKKGGKVSSASKRADGCAVKGKTKGKMV